MTDPDRDYAVKAIELLSLKEAKAILNAGWPALQLVRLRAFDQGRDVYRVTIRGLGLTFDGPTPGKALRNAFLYSESITSLTGTVQFQFYTRSPVDERLRTKTKRAFRKASQY